MPVLTLLTFVGAFTYGAQTVQLVVYVQQRLDLSADGYGYLLAATGAGGVLGATLVGFGFVLPSFVMVVILGWAYWLYGGLNWMQAVFYGVGACVIGIIAISAYKLATKSIGKDKLLWAIYLVTAAFTVWTESESIWLFLGGGLLVWLVRARPKRWFGTNAAPGLIALSPHASSTCAIAIGFDWTLLAQLGAFFAKAGAFVFGSGLAIVPFLYGGVVHDYQWLNEKQFVDAVANGLLLLGLDSNFLQILGRIRRFFDVFV